MAGTSDAYERFNREAKRWAQLTGAAMRRAAPSATGALRKSIKPRTFSNRSSLAIEAIRFSLVRHGIYVEQGVGKYRRTGTPAAEAAAQPFMAPVLAARVAELERVIAQYYGDDTAVAIARGLPTAIEFKTK